MPIYEYICHQCGADFEIIQKISDPPLTEHEGCGGKLEKKLSLSAFHLKGGGWYTDGYSQKPSDQKSPDKGEAKSETNKPPAKEPAKKSKESSTS